jgi:hypothetical protein
LPVVALVLLLVGAARPAQAASVPFIDVAAFGIELCPQSVCGAAIFTGILHGQVGANPFALGTFAVAITHDPLPEEPLATAELTGGAFEFRFGLRRIRGVVTGGVLINNGNNTFSTRVLLRLLEGGRGDAVFDGLLNHNVFPPTIVGRVHQ